MFENHSYKQIFLLMIPDLKKRDAKNKQHLF